MSSTGLKQFTSGVIAATSGVILLALYWYHKRIKDGKSTTSSFPSSNSSQSDAKLQDLPPAKVIMVGLDGAGKTTILYKLKLGKSGEIVTTIPTLGFNVETVEYPGLSLIVWDIGGQDKIRPIWRHYYNDAQGIIFVVDSNDRDRIDDSQNYEHSAKEELHRILAENELKNAVLLVFANKQDFPTAMKVQEVTERLELNKLQNRKWFIQGTSTATGNGLFEGLNWLVKNLSK